MRLGTRRRRREAVQAVAHADAAATDAATDALPAPGAPPVPEGAGQPAADADADADADAVPGPRRRPLYHRLLRLRHIAPTAWQRAAFADAPFALAVVLVLADVASAWTLVVLPLAVAVIVKAHDLLAGALAGPAPHPPVQDGSRE